MFYFDGHVQLGGAQDEYFVLMQVGRGDML